MLYTGMPFDALYPGIHTLYDHIQYTHCMTTYVHQWCTMEYMARLPIELKAPLTYYTHTLYKDAGEQPIMVQ